MAQVTTNITDTDVCGLHDVFEAVSREAKVSAVCEDLKETGEFHFCKQRCLCGAGVGGAAGERMVKGSRLSNAFFSDMLAVEIQRIQKVIENLASQVSSLLRS